MSSAVLRRVVFVLPLLVFVLACPTAPASSPGPRAHAQADPAPAPSPTHAPSPSVAPPAPAAPADRPPTQPLEPTPEPVEPSAGPEPDPEPGEPAPGEPAPGEPELGSPESDAELLALLDDSTLTQDEFAKAFGTDKAPKIDAQGQIELGASERSQVEIGAATKLSGKPDLAGIDTLARADRHALEACHAMALSKDPKALGRVTLELEFDAAGEVLTVAATSKLARSLTDCLASVAEGWRSPKSAEARVSVPLTLAIRAM